MSSQDSKSISTANGGLLNRRNILTASTTVAFASALGSIALRQTTLAQAQTALAAQAPITEEEAHAIGVDAYLYFYPLISFDITRLYSTNIEPDKEPLTPAALGCIGLPRGIGSSRAVATIVLCIGRPPRPRSRPKCLRLRYRSERASFTCPNSRHVPTHRS
jgi:hypothetical protein